MHSSFLKIGIAAVLVLLFVCCGAAAGDTHDHSGWTAWNTTTALPSDSGNYYLTTDVTLTRTWTVPSGTTNLCLNGYVIKLELVSDTGSVINVPSDATLNLYDCNTTAMHYFTYKASGAWVAETDTSGAKSISEFNRSTAVDGNSVFYVTGGVITGGSDGNGGGVYVENGKFEMSGTASIKGNSASTTKYGGGGVCVWSGTFTMKGDASIKGNSASSGGGVYVKNGKFEMSDGSITGNSATGHGGGVYNDGTFEMSGGTIGGTGDGEGNSATGHGGGVCVTGTNSKFTMSGGSITGNSATNVGSLGGGVYVSSGEFTMEGDASIVGNSAGKDGGGVYNDGTFTMSDTASITVNSATDGNGGGVYNDGTFEMSGGTIGGTGDGEGNSATDGNGGGVYVSMGTFTMTGGSITGNSATYDGGGVYFNYGAFNVSGTPKISGNKKKSDGTANNVDLPYEKITVTGDFSGEIYIYTEDQPTSQFGTTDGETQHAGAANFISDYTNGGKHYVGVWGTSEVDKLKLFWSGEPKQLYEITISETENGTVTASSLHAAENTTITLTVTPVAGYQLKELQYCKTGETTPVTITNKTFTMPGYNVTVTADFELILSYTVTLDKNGGTDGTDSVTATYGQSMPPATMPTRDGYTFNGYFDATTGGTEYYNADGDSAENWDKTENTTLYAHWTANTYNITYKDKGDETFSGTHESGYPTQHTYGTATTLKSASKTGYNFDGWFTTIDCSGTAVTSLGATAYTADMTLYAKWTANQQPSHSSSRDYGSSIWLTATPTPTPVPTVEPTQAQPTAAPIKPQPTSASPAPLAAVLAGLGAAGVLFGLRRK